MLDILSSQDSPAEERVMQHPTWLLDALPGIHVDKPVYNDLSLKPNSNLHILLPHFNINLIFHEFTTAMYIRERLYFVFWGTLPRAGHGDTSHHLH